MTEGQKQGQKVEVPYRAGGWLLVCFFFLPAAVCMSVHDTKIDVRGTGRTTVRMEDGGHESCALPRGGMSSRGGRG